MAERSALFLWHTRKTLFSLGPAHPTTPTPPPGLGREGTIGGGGGAVLPRGGLLFAHGEGRRLAVREGLRRRQPARTELRRLMRLRRCRRRLLHVPHLGRRTGRTRASGEAMPLPLRSLPR